MRLRRKKDNEFDEELKFLMDQIEFADRQKVKLMEKIEEVEEGKISYIKPFFRDERA